MSYSENTRWFNRIFVKDNHKNEHFYAIIILFDFWQSYFVKICFQFTTPLKMLILLRYFVPRRSWIEIKCNEKLVHSRFISFQPRRINHLWYLSWFHGQHYCKYEEMFRPWNFSTSLRKFVPICGAQGYHSPHVPNTKAHHCSCYWCHKQHFYGSKN